MAELSRKTVEEFQALFKKEYGVDYTYKEAWEAAHNLIGFFDLLLKIDSKNKKKEKNV